MVCKNRATEGFLNSVILDVKESFPGARVLMKNFYEYKKNKEWILNKFSIAQDADWLHSTSSWNSQKVSELSYYDDAKLTKGKVLVQGTRCIQYK